MMEITLNIVALFSSLYNAAWLGGVALVQDAESFSGTLQLETQESDVPDKIQELGDSLNQTQAVQDVSAGILEPIYRLAEYMAFESFYWVAFALMVAGVVSFAGQLVFTKLFLLFKLNLNIQEILADALGLLVSLTGLVLTTQAATQNSSFPDNAIAVVTATAVGAVLGLVFYLWGQKLEFQAARRIPKPDRE